MIKVNDLTLGEIKELTRFFNNSNNTTSLKEIDVFAIVVLDRGFVYIGRLQRFDDEHYVLKDSSNIRVWGTTNGLGELVLKGKLSNTKIDKCGELYIPKKSVISIHPTKEDLWK